MKEIEIDYFEVRKEDSGDILFLLPQINSYKYINSLHKIKGKKVDNTYLIHYYKDNNVVDRILKIKNIGMAVKLNLFMRKKVHIVEIDAMDIIDYPVES